MKTARKEEALKKQMHALRVRIDQLDHRLLVLLQKRLAMVERIGVLKKQLGLPIVQKQRSQEILRDRRQKALHLGLAPDFIESIYHLIFRQAIQRQTEAPRNRQKRGRA